MPTVYFPQLASNGHMVERGATFGDAYLTSKNDSPVAGRSAWALRGAGLTNFPTEPLGEWTLPYASLNDSERTALEDFFRAWHACYGLLRSPMSSRPWQMTPRRWAIENGGNPEFRIALCGYAGEHENEMPPTGTAFPGKRQRAIRSSRPTVRIPGTMNDSGYRLIV